MGGLTKARLEAKLSRKELGERVGKSETTIGRYETGKRPITDEMASKMGVELGTSPIDIKPDFNEAIISALSPAGQRIYRENLRILFVAEGKRKAG